MITVCVFSLLLFSHRRSARPQSLSVVLFSAVMALADLLSSVRDLYAAPGGPSPPAIVAALDAGAPMLADAGRDALAAALDGEPAAPMALPHLYLL